MGQRNRKSIFLKKMFRVRQTCGINSFIGSLTTFRGEPKFEGPTLCFVTRGEPVELRGERGGVLPAGNIDGKELPVAEFALDEFPEIFKGAPVLASLTRDVT